MSETHKPEYDLAIERMKRYVADAVIHNGKDSCQDTSVVTIGGEFYKLSVTMSRVPKPSPLTKYEMHMDISSDGSAVAGGF